jgi:hypothetical protein
MRLVETDIPHGDEEVAEVPRPPRPEHRRVYVSLAVTLSVLVATVAAVYLAFPERHNELLTDALEAHRADGPFELDRPSRAELMAWSVGVVGKKAPWPPEGGGLEALGTRRLKILRRPAALVRYRLGRDEISLLVTRATDAPPRKHSRVEDGDLAESWRRGAWTFVAVGPAAHARVWKARFGVP